jgi:hypothetical protein
LIATVSSDARSPTIVDTSRPAEHVALALRGLLFGFVGSVTSDAAEKVPTGGELTLFEAVGRARA